MDCGYLRARKICLRIAKNVLALRKITNMTSNIIQVDIGPLDSEIKSIEDQIAGLEAALKIKRELRQYILEHGVSGTLSTKENGNGHTGTFVEKPFDFGPTLVIPANASVSQFIVAYIKNRHKVQPDTVLETSDIVKAYAKHTNKEPVDIRNNVYNALNRLKDVELTAETVEGKGTSVWRIKKRKEHA
jgi:hypothetical protein